MNLALVLKTDNHFVALLGDDNIFACDRLEVIDLRLLVKDRTNFGRRIARLSLVGGLLNG